MIGKKGGSMDDLISRQEAIYAVNTALFPKINTAKDAEKALRNLPSAQPETHEERTETHGVCLDVIDRQAAIDTLDKHLRTTDVPVSYPGIISALTEWLNELPSAQADSKELSGTHKALDTVSRQAVIEAINKIFPADPMRDDYTQGITCGAALANIYVAQLPSAQPEQTNSWYINSWCNNCKEYDTENKCCPRYNRVIKQTLDDAYRHGETEAEARFYAEIVRCKDCVHYVKDHGWNGIEYMVCNISPLHKVLRKPNDYCSRAERETDA